MFVRLVFTKEHQKQGSVKMEVYNQYIYAASKVGIADDLDELVFDPCP